jgi:thiol:disulfide interchange protein
MNSRNYFIALLLMVLLPLQVMAQLSDPVSFSVKEKRVSPTEIDLIFTGSIEPGWHIYSTDLSGGPTPATFHIDKASGVEPVGKLQPGKGERSAMDPVFQMKVRYFEHSATFTQRLKLTAKNFSAKGYLEYGACNDQNCMPPTPVDFSVHGSDGPATAAAAPQDATVPTGQTVAGAAAPVLVSDSVTTDSAAATAAQPVKIDDQLKAQWWQPSIKQLQAFGDGTTHNRSLPVIFLLGMLGGLIALLTPCVWPIIPMTVSFFLHRNNNRRRAIREAVLYGLSIVVIYVGLGLLVTLLSSKGSYALNDLSTNAVFNIFLFLLLIVFAASFLGGFEITLPSSWNNKVNQKADTTTGLLSIFLMALTLTLVSFSCTGPIIGFLLVEISTQGNILYPAVGMLGFAIALALPFSFFALFPSLLKKLPKSGGWMNVIKVTLGFIELAFALKFLSVADLAYGWHILDRETFLALWIVIFALLGLYLLGKIRFPADDKSDVTSVPRFFMGLVSLAFAVYMVPGLWGAPLKAVSAFSPPIYTQDFNLNRMR